MQIDGSDIFGSFAEDYDRYRPNYPVDALRPVLHRLARKGTAVDIGCGTGKLAAALAAGGLRVTGVEPDRRMAAVAVRRGIPVEVCTFEDWAPSATFDLVACGQAWHWLAPDLRAEKVRRRLRPGGTLLLVWNLPTRDDALRRELDETAAAVLPPGWDEPSKYAEQSSPIDLELFCGELRRHGFGEVRREVLPWHRDYSAERWCGLLGTQSGYLALPPSQREDLLTAIRCVVDNRHGGSVRLEYDCVVVTACRQPASREALASANDQ